MVIQDEAPSLCPPLDAAAFTNTCVVGGVGVGVVVVVVGDADGGGGGVHL